MTLRSTVAAVAVAAAVVLVMEGVVVKDHDMDIKIMLNSNLEPVAIRTI